MGPQIKAAGRGKSIQCENRSDHACHAATKTKGERLLFPQAVVQSA